MTAKEKTVDEDFGVICVCAERYALGRCSYMPWLVQEFIYRNMVDIETTDLFTMIRDVQEAENLGFGYGDEKIDKPGWMAFVRRLQEEVERRKQDEPKTRKEAAGAKRI